MFNRENITKKKKADLMRNLSISDGSFVFGYLGSLGSDYLLDDMIRAFYELSKIKKEAVFLFISNNGKDKVIKAFEDLRLDLKRLRFVSIERRDVPKYLSLLDLSIFLLCSSFNIEI